MNRLAPADITYKNMRFLIAHSPTNVSLNKFLQELKKNKILDWPFGDGGSPTSQTADKWLKFVQQKFREVPGSCIVVHCATGLGKAPLLVALALIEGGMKHETAIQFLRPKCRGAFNSKQLLYLEKCQPRMCLCFRNTSYNCFIQ
ncbi:PREDICTED: protein tyrosine phosphatase type IVA 1-like isoform X2 [Hipposideros armiger]|uniref:Protein tyrosine phosphatase type IVA 3 n=1 Tax=Hipposideros armiger TaxID=186990 RepID=A0A8B7TIC9_HIPAR|nr:PREDICTED: protein tyrosine phosphatase type IVA 1-like isoform X2 [Hipposideros armiger]